MMVTAFTSGTILDIILMFVGLEAAALVAWRLWRGSGPSPTALIANIAAGACLMLAVRAALVGADWTIIAACLLGSLFAHVTDVLLRFRHEQSRLSDVRSQSREPGTSPDTPAFNRRRQARMISS